jgi:hypothetical protein
MKDRLKNIRIRDKITTAACRTENGIEWTTVTVNPDGVESMQQGHLPVVLPEEPTEEQLAALEFPTELAEDLEGDITLSLRTSGLLMRVMNFPTNDPDEIADMVGFQIDKVSPFPADQLAIAHEVLRTDENNATVLMVAAKRQNIDAIGDAFEKQGMHVHSIDARILGWQQLMREQDNLPHDGCEILLVNDGIDVVLTVFADGIPLAFRSLHAQVDDMDAVEELAYEIAYTLTTLDAEYDLPEPSAIRVWSIRELPAQFTAKLTKTSGIITSAHDLNILPPLSEGILRRACHAQGQGRIELIPREWVELQKRKTLIRKFSLISGGIAALWLFILLIFFSIYKVRDIALANANKRAEAIAPAATIAAENQEKLKKLTAYTDRSDSALECLREATRMLPAGDIEFGSYSYTKGKGVTLRGTAQNDDIVNDFFLKLSNSSLFDRLKDQSINTKTTKGIRRAIFSVTLALPAEEDSK